jgi:hypothetical protein
MLSENEDMETNLDSFLNNEYVQSDLEESDLEQENHSIDGYSETESVDLRENDTYQVFSSLMEDEEGNNISKNIKTLNTTYKNELKNVNNNLDNINKTLGALYGLLKNYMKIQLSQQSQQLQQFKNSKNKNVSEKIRKKSKKDNKKR